MNNSSNTPALVALICGILCLVGSIIPIVQYFTTILAILAIVFGVKGRNVAMTTGDGLKAATWGMILGIIGVFFAVCGLICTLVCAGTANTIMNYVSSLQ